LGRRITSTNIFSNRLKHEGLTSAEALFGNEKLSPQLLKLLDKNQMTVLDKEEVVIFDKNKKILYESGTDYFDIPTERLDEVIQNGEIIWQVGQGEIFGFRYHVGTKELLIFSSAVDVYGLSKQRNLAIMLITGCLLTTLVVFLQDGFLQDEHYSLSIVLSNNLILLRHQTWICDWMKEIEPMKLHNCLCVLTRCWSVYKKHFVYRNHLWHTPHMN
jgi:hypothetical protein